MSSISKSILTRRNFLHTVTAATVAGVLHRSTSLAEPASAKEQTQLDPFQQRLSGPIYSNPCPFKSDLSLDDNAQRKAIARALKSGIGVFACTAGNTQYTTMSMDEVKQVNRVMVEAVNGQALTIAATGDWETEQAVDFAKFAGDIRADALQVLLPKKFAENEDGALGHFQAIASATKLPLVLHGKFNDSLLKKLVGIESVRAMKEDHMLEDFIRQQIDHGQRLSIFAGGGENRFYVGYPYGTKSYYSTYSTFAPDIAAKVWKVIQSGDIKAAAQMTVKYDYPFIRRFTHGMWHATLEIFHLGSRHVRAPQKVLTDEQMAELKQFYVAQGVDPDQYQ